MKSRTHLVILGPGCAALLGCAATPIETMGGLDVFDSRPLIYDELVLDIVAPGAEASMDVTLESKADGAREGVKMMLQAPLGCLTAGPMAGVFCIALAPFFPFLGANTVQDVETSHAELETMANRFDRADIQHRFRQALEAEVAAAGLPLVESASPDARVAILHAELGEISLEHDGNKNGYITLTQPYRFWLSYGDAQTETLVEGENYRRFDVAPWTDKSSAQLTDAFARWIGETAALGVHDTLLEWQPKVVLGPVSPQLTERRNAIGFKQTELPFVESTTPRLAWQPLAAVLDPTVLVDVTDITYELEIFRPRGFRHAVAGLETPEYLVTEDLAPCAYYYWRPVARFRYRGVMHTTSLNKRRWSKAEFVSDDFIFKTPAPDCKDPGWQATEPVREQVP